MDHYLDGGVNENSPMVWTEIELSHNKPENKKEVFSSVSKATEEAHNALISSITSSSPRSPLSEFSSDITGPVNDITGTGQSCLTDNFKMSYRAVHVTPIVTANLQFDTEPRLDGSIIRRLPETPVPGDDNGNNKGKSTDHTSNVASTPSIVIMSGGPEESSVVIVDNKSAEELSDPEEEDDCDSGNEVEVAYVETEQERIQREIEESERLCWEMMQQESMEAYNMQVNYMRENSEGMSEEDRATLELILQQENQQVQQLQQQQNHNFDDGEGEEGEYDGQQQDQQNEGLDENSENWDYDQLLALGEAIGDVKTEKWKLRALQVIQSLPRLSYGEIRRRIALQKKHKEDNDRAAKARLAALESDNGGEVFSLVSPEKVLPCASTLDQFTVTGTPITCSHISVAIPSGSSNNCTSTITGAVSASSTMLLVLETHCAICRDEYESDSSVLHLRCGHYFHDECCASWLNVSVVAYV